MFPSDFIRNHLASNEIKAGIWKYLDTAKVRLQVNGLHVGQEIHSGDQLSYRAFLYAATSLAASDDIFVKSCYQFVPRIMHTSHKRPSCFSSLSVKI